MQIIYIYSKRFTTIRVLRKLFSAVDVKTFLPTLKKRKDGKIILMGSESALQGAKQGSIYCATKFALRGFAQSLRHECRHAGIAVTLINPGPVNTPFFDKLDFAPASLEENAIHPNWIAKTILHLLSLDNHAVIEEINLQPMIRIIKKIE
jgi:3-hydroxy acid dehydrogenase / malonic semialdehyde reductase